MRNCVKIQLNFVFWILLLFWIFLQPGNRWSRLALGGHIPLINNTIFSSNAQRLEKMLGNFKYAVEKMLQKWHSLQVDKVVKFYKNYYLLLKKSVIPFNNRGSCIEENHNSRLNYFYVRHCLPHLNNNFRNIHERHGKNLQKKIIKES